MKIAKPASYKGKTMNKRPKCKCGRSPNGNCVGWHAYTEEKYKEALLSFNTAAKQMGRPTVEPKTKK